MADFSQVTLTNKGEALKTKALAGECQIVFTKVQSGTGVWNSSLKEATALKSPKQSFGISQVTVINDSTIDILGIISNEGLTEEYTVYEYGIFAQEKGDDSTEVLYAISTDDDGVKLRAYNSIAPQTIQMDSYVSVADAQSIEFKAGGALALAEDLGNIGDLTTDDKSSAVAAINGINAYMRKLVSFRYDKEKRQAISMLPMGYADGKLTIPESLGSNSKTDETTVILA